MLLTKRGCSNDTLSYLAALTKVCKYKALPETVTVAPDSIMPLLGLTQYRRGAVVFTLKHTFRSEGFFSLRFVVTTSVKGPVLERKEMVLRVNGVTCTMHTTDANDNQLVTRYGK